MTVRRMAGVRRGEGIITWWAFQAGVQSVVLQVSANTNMHCKILSLTQIEIADAEVRS